MKAVYLTRLSASRDCVRFLLHQELAFCCDDETDNSMNRGNFLGFLHFLADHNDDIKKIVLENAPGNLKVIAPDIQKDISNAFASEITSVIVNDVGHELFAILCDESRDTSIKEEMAIVIPYVDSLGCVIELFLGVVHVSITTALSLKKAIDDLFSNLSLSISQIRGQGYDGASNMSGAFNGSSKRQEILREIRLNEVVDGLLNGELVCGRGLNQETCLRRAFDTRYGTHFGSLLKLILMYDFVIQVLEIIEKDSLIEQRGKAHGFLNVIQSFEFIFIIHLMKSVLGMTNVLSEVLQRKDQDIVNSMNLVNIFKKELQVFRDNG